MIELFTKRRVVLSELLSVKEDLIGMTQVRPIEVRQKFNSFILLEESSKKVEREPLQKNKATDIHKCNIIRKSFYVSNAYYVRYRYKDYICQYFTMAWFVIYSITQNGLV